MPSPAEVDAFSGAVGDLSTLAIADLSALWDSVEGEAPDAIEAVLLEAVPVALDPYVTASAEMATVWYDELAPGSEYVAVPAAAPPPAQVQASVRWALGPLYGRGQSPILNLLAGAAQRYVTNGARDTLTFNASREGVTYARHARANACAFCRMLASRTNEYRSERASFRVVGRRGGRTRGTQKVGEKFHDHCFCTPVPVREGDIYNPPDYMHGWLDEYEKAAAENQGGNLKDIMRDMRKNDAPYVRAKSIVAPADPVSHIPRLLKPRTPAAAVTSTNPGRDRATASKDAVQFKNYNENCQRVVSAYELRRRGYDVVAAPLTNHLSLGEMSTGWKLPDGTWPKWVHAKAPADGAALSRRISREYPPGARGSMYVSWKKMKTAHVLNWERDTDGAVHYYDAQVSQDMTGNIDQYLSRSVKAHTWLLRLDDAAPDWAVMNAQKVWDAA